MKKTVGTIIFLAALTVMVAGCHKESPETATGVPYGVGEGSETKRLVVYVVNGEGGQLEIIGEEAWQAFLHRMVDTAENGNTVIIGNAGNSFPGSAEKETVTHTTADKNDAVAWADTMITRGYTVEIRYNRENEVFVCIAQRKTMHGVGTAGYHFIPLEQYLPGEWRLDPRLVSVDADFRNGLWRFLATYVLHDALVDSPNGNDVESIIFDTAGNAFFRGTNRESVDETYVICQDSVARIGGLNDDWNTKVFQLNADSIVVCGYNPVGVSSPMIMVDEGWLFYRVRE